jgi:hypothetical protein
MDGADGTAPPGWPLVAGLAVCAVAAAALGLAALRAPDRSAAAPPAPGPVAGAPGPVAGAPGPVAGAPGPVAGAGWPAACAGDCRSTVAAAPASGPPTRVRIPRIGVDSPLAVLGLDRSGELAPPAGFTRAGWYGGGPAPGDTGPAVIAGHLDSKTGPAVFARLPELVPGDRIEVLRGARWLPFRVVDTARAPKDRFPTRAVYAPTPGPELRLVTCGGEFDRRSRHYRDNVVVFAVADRPAEPRPSSAAG